MKSSLLFIPLFSSSLSSLQERGSSAGYLVCGLGWMKGDSGRLIVCVCDWYCVCVCVCVCVTDPEDMKSRECMMDPDG